MPKTAFLTALADSPCPRRSLPITGNDGLHLPPPTGLAELRACAKEWAENPTALLDGDDTIG